MDGVFVFSMEDFYQDEALLPLMKYQLLVLLYKCYVSSVLVDKIGITNQASDDSFAVDFVANVTGATALADPIVIDVDGDGLNFVSPVNLILMPMGIMIVLDGSHQTRLMTGLSALDVDGAGVPTLTSGSIKSMKQPHYRIF